MRLNVRGALWANMTGIEFSMIPGGEEQAMAILLHSPALLFPL
jgi:hypothetical protein